MAVNARTRRDVEAYSSIVEIVGSFYPAAGGAVTGPVGRGFTVARTNVGIYTVTITDPVYEVIGIESWGQLNAPGGEQIMTGPVTHTAGALSFEIHSLSILGALADIAAHANNRVGFVAYVHLTASP